MRIAITGATGLIGHAISEMQRASGHDVVRVGRGVQADVTFDQALDEFLAPESLAGCEALVHAAGVTDEDFADRQLAFDKAVHGAQALLDAALEAGVRRLVYVSSTHVYGPLEGLIDETRAPNPLSDYAIAHFATEQLFRRAGLKRGVSTLLVRPCAVFGMPPSLERFNRWSLIPFDFPRQAVAGRIVLRSPGTQRRNFVSIEGLGYLVGWWLGRSASGTTVASCDSPYITSTATNCPGLSKPSGFGRSISAAAE